ncbi:alpha-N-arabinofuranosidase [Aquipuribacter sp. MA13-13]|uniref:alpha-N-arabinofuranosidase n=1 Tax=Aquipuribacter sp. MA13-13 TaxID=3440840 RepID=UPI003EEEBAF5
MPDRASVVLDPRFTVAPVDRRVFGSFVEHMGRSVYTGIYEPDHATADEAGFRGDVKELVRELGPTVLRYPGGNFVSSYRWEDGVGPVDERPVRLDLAWRSLESNAVGINEFCAWARELEVEPMMAVNLGTRGVQEAVDLLEYSNHPGGTALSDLRVSHGVKDPHGIRLWCLGNEQDGPWQIGQKTAEEYGRLAAETGKAMRLVDPEIELVAVGSSNSQMPTFASWEATVLEHTYAQVDYISLHAYYEQVEDDLGTFLATAVDMDRFIDAVVATADHVGAKLRDRKKLKLSFDEWNVWYQKRFVGQANRDWQENRHLIDDSDDVVDAVVATADHVGAKLRDRKRLTLSFDEWNVWYQKRFVGQANLDWQENRHLIEDSYDVADAVVVGSYLISLLNHADRVTVACQAQLVNVIAPILTEPGGRAWRQTIFHPFAQAARSARGTVLRTTTTSPTYPTESYGQVPLLHATATHDEETGEVVVLAVNRGQEDVLELEVDVRAFGGTAGMVVVEHSVLADDDIRARNTADDPDRVTPRRGSGARVEDGRARLALPPVSWNVLRLRPAPA